MRLSLILRTRSKGSIILQQSCNYEDGVERGDNNNENKIDKTREKIKRTDINYNLFNYWVFYVTNSNKIEKTSLNLS